MSREIHQHDQWRDFPPPKAGRISEGVAELPENPYGSKGFSGPLGDVSQPFETERLGNMTSRDGENPGNTFPPRSKPQAACDHRIIAELEQVRQARRQGPASRLPPRPDAIRLPRQQGGGRMTGRPLAIDLFCGLGGWTDGLLAEGYDVIGFDIERHKYGDAKYPAQLAVQDVLTLHGSQFKTADLIVASPPCQEYSYMAMPWTLAKTKAADIRADTTGAALEKLNRLFNACFRIQKEACEAAGRHIPLIVENVRGAEPWVGRARWNFGSFYLWGDVPALMPPTFKATKVPSEEGRRTDMGKGTRFTSRDCGVEGRKNGGDWFGSGENASLQHKHGSKSSGRKHAAAMIAKIPLPLGRFIAATYRPQLHQAAE